MKRSEKTTVNSVKKFSFWRINYLRKIQKETIMTYDTKNDTPSLPMPRTPRLTLWMSVRLFILWLIYG